MSMKKSGAQPVEVTPEATEPGSQGVIVGLLVAGMFLVGFVVLIVGGAFAYSSGVPMFVVGLVAIVLLGVVFTLLRRWADRVDEQASAEA